MKKRTSILILQAACMAAAAWVAFCAGRSSALRQIPDTTDIEIAALDYKYRTFEASELLINLMLFAAKDEVQLPRYTWADFKQKEAERFNSPEKSREADLRGALIPSNQTMHKHRKHLRAAPRPSTENGAQDNGRRPG